MKGEIRIRVNKKHARIKQFFKPVIRKNQTNDLIEKILRFVINFFFLPLQERFLTTQNPFQFVPGYRGSSQFPILLPPNRRKRKTTLFDRFTALSCCPIAMRGGSRVVAGGQSLFVCRDNFPSSLSLHYRSYNRDSTCNRTYDCWSIGVHSRFEAKAFSRLGRPMIARALL